MINLQIFARLGVPPRRFDSAAPVHVFRRGKRDPEPWERRPPQSRNPLYLKEFRSVPRLCRMLALLAFVGPFFFEKGKTEKNRFFKKINIG